MRRFSFFSIFIAWSTARAARLTLGSDVVVDAPHWSAFIGNQTCVSETRSVFATTVVEDPCSATGAPFVDAYTVAIVLNFHEGLGVQECSAFEKYRNLALRGAWIVIAWSDSKPMMGTPVPGRNHFYFDSETSTDGSALLLHVISAEDPNSLKLVSPGACESRWKSEVFQHSAMYALFALTPLLYLWTLPLVMLRLLNFREKLRRGQQVQLPIVVLSVDLFSSLFVVLTIPIGLGGQRLPQNSYVPARVAYAFSYQLIGTMMFITTLMGFYFREQSKALAGMRPPRNTLRSRKPGVFLAATSMIFVGDVLGSFLYAFELVPAMSPYVVGLPYVAMLVPMTGVFYRVAEHFVHDITTKLYGNGGSKGSKVSSSHTAKAEQELSRVNSKDSLINSPQMTRTDSKSSLGSKGSQLNLNETLSRKASKQLLITRTDSWQRRDSEDKKRHVRSVRLLPSVLKDEIRASASRRLASKHDVLAFDDEGRSVRRFVLRSVIWLNLTSAFLALVAVSFFLSLMNVSPNDPQAYLASTWLLTVGRWGMAHSAAKTLKPKKNEPIVKEFPTWEDVPAIDKKAKKKKKLKASKSVGPPMRAELTKKTSNAQIKVMLEDDSPGAPAEEELVLMQTTDMNALIGNDDSSDDD